MCCPSDKLGLTILDGIEPEPTCNAVIVGGYCIDRLINGTIYNKVINSPLLYGLRVRAVPGCLRWLL